MTTLVILGLASATVSVTVGASKLFAPFRVWLMRHWHFGGELVGCPYCLGHWVSAALMYGYGIRRGWLVWVTLWLTTTAISALAAGTITLLFTAGGTPHDDAPS